MNREEIIKMAREAGDYLVDKRGREDFIFDCYGIEHFANLVAAAEREACAKVCQELDAKHRSDYCTGLYYATAIRARGQS